METMWCHRCQRVVRVTQSHLGEIYLEEGKVVEKRSWSCIWCRAEVKSEIIPYHRIVSFPGGAGPGSPKPPDSSRPVSRLLRWLFGRSSAASTSPHTS